MMLLEWAVPVFTEGSPGDLQPCVLPTSSKSPHRRLPMHPPSASSCLNLFGLQIKRMFPEKYLRSDSSKP